MPQLPEDRWKDDHASVRDWLYEHPAYALSGPPYTHEKARSWRAVYNLINVFEGDFYIDPFFVQLHAQECLRVEIDQEVRAIYQAFIDEVERQKRPIGYSTGLPGEYYHLVHLPPDVPAAHVMYNFRFEIWLYTCNRCGQLLIDEPSEETEHCDASSI